MHNLESFEFGALSLQLFIETKPFQNQILKIELRNLLFAFGSVGLSLSFSINPTGFV